MATIVTRSGKGSPLTSAELDQNQINLNTDKAELSGATFTGAITANAGVVVDNITIDGNEIDVGSGNLTLDVASTTIIDSASSGQLVFKYQGIEYGTLFHDSNHFYIQSQIDDGDIIFRGQDGSSTITALTLDMSAAGAATFNDSVTTGGKLALGQTTSFPTTGLISHTNGYLYAEGGSNGIILRSASGGAQMMFLTPAEVVVNNDSLDMDFRVESNGNSHMLFVDGGLNKVGIGVVPVQGSLTIKSGGNTYATSALVLEDTDSTTRSYITHVNGDLAISNNGSTDQLVINAAGAATFNSDVHANSFSLNDERYMFFGTSDDARIHFDGTDSLYITCNNGTADKLKTNANTTMMMQANGNQLLTLSANSEVVVNEDSNDINFRVESDNLSHALFLNGANGQIGIGDSSPSSKFVVDGGRASEGVTAGGTYTELTRASGGDLGILFNKDTAKWLVGIDNSDGNAGPLRFEYGAFGSTHPGLGSGVLGLSLSYLGGISNTPSAGGHTVFNEGGVDADFRVESNNQANMLYVDGGTDRVGIGCVPSYKLDIRNDVASSTDLDPVALRLYNNSDGGSAILFENGVSGKSKLAFGVEGTGNQTDETYIAFETGANTSMSERMRIDSNGTIRTTSSDGTAPTIGTGCVSVQGRSNSGSVGILRLYKTGDDGNIVDFYRTGNTLVGKITVSSTSTSYVTSSDYRLKENVVGMSGATERLKQLKPSRFNFIADADTTVDGFLAHEVENVVPEAITGEKDAVDADGNPDYQGIDQSKLVPLLVATIQELEARLTALENS